MNVPAEEAGDDGEELMKQVGEGLPIVPGEGTIRVGRLFGGGRIDRPG